MTGRRDEKRATDDESWRRSAAEEMSMKHEHKVSRERRFEASSLLTSRTMLYADEYGSAESALSSIPRAFVRHVKFVALFAAVGSLLVFAAGVAVPPTYTGRAQLIVDPPKSDRDFSTKKDEGAVQAEAEDSKSVIETHIAVMNSRYILERAATELWGPEEIEKPSEQYEPRATVAPNFAGELRRRVAIWLDALPLSSLWRPKTKEQAKPGYGDIERRLKIKQEGDAKIISVSFTSRDPELAASVTNKIAELYVRTRVEEEQAALKLELERTNDRIRVLYAEADKADSSARNLIRSHGGAGYASPAAAPARNASSYQRIHEALSEATGARQLQPALERRRSYLQSRLENVKPDIRILTAASMPEEPSSFNPFVLAGASVAPLLFLGGWLASWLGRSDNRLRSGDEVLSALGIPCVGILPQLPRLRRRPPDPRLLSDPISSYTEAIRSLIGELCDRPAEGGVAKARVILVTSSVPNEGKTTLCLSLGSFVCLRNRKALVLDCDSWCSVLSSTTPDITRFKETLVENGTAPQSSYVGGVSTDKAGLDRLTLRSQSPSAFEIWGDKPFSARLDKLRETYDYIFIDAPPVLQVANTRLLASLADEIFFAVQWEKTTVKEARNALKLLQCARLPKIGVVLTQINLRRHARYGYRDYAQSLLSYERYAKGKAKLRRHSRTPKAESAYVDIIPHQADMKPK